MSGTVAISCAYDNRIKHSSENATFVLDDAFFMSHQRWMRTATEILGQLRAKLDAKQTTQAAIGKVLGVAQANVSTFWTPGKNGKLRQLKWDEALKLSEAFDIPLGDGDQVAEPEWPSAYTLAPLLDALLPLVPKSGLSEKSAEALSEGLAYGLRLLGAPTATPPTDDSLRVAARGAVARFRDLALQ